MTVTRERGGEWRKASPWEGVRGEDSGMREEEVEEEEGE